jgi:uncharacterized membrane protein
MTGERMDRLIGGLLRAGVILSAAVTVAGGVWYLIQTGGTMPRDRVFHAESPELRSVSGVLRGIAAGHAASLIQLGLLLLMATPVARVALSVYAFASEGDRTYVILTLIVLAALAASLTGFRL